MTYFAIDDTDDPISIIRLSKSDWIYNLCWNKLVVENMQRKYDCLFLTVLFIGLYWVEVSVMSNAFICNNFDNGTQLLPPLAKWCIPSVFNS